MRSSRGGPAARGPAETARLELGRILDAPPATFDSSAQRAALEALDAVEDADVAATRDPIERACFDGRGQDMAPLIALYLDKLARSSPEKARREGERLLVRCGVYEWQPRGSRTAWLRRGLQRFATASETEVNQAAVARAQGTVTSSDH